jgi:uncharacterized protein (UPF0262 family)
VPAPETSCIASIELDEKSVVRRSAQIEHERKVAIFDLLEDNTFTLTSGRKGPYGLRLSMEDSRLVFDVQCEKGEKLERFSLSIRAFRRTVRDYFMICDSYFQAIKVKAPSQIEAIDMARRGLHNEGAELLRERMAEHADMNTDTARRLFTLVCVLHIRSL